MFGLSSADRELLEELVDRLGERAEEDAAANRCLGCRDGPTATCIRDDDEARDRA